MLTLLRRTFERVRTLLVVLIGLLAGEDHLQLNPQIAWFATELASTTIRFVIAHDPRWNAALLERGMLVPGFVLRNPDDGQPAPVPG